MTAGLHFVLWALLAEGSGAAPADAVQPAPEGSGTSPGEPTSPPPPESAQPPTPAPAEIPPAPPFQLPPPPRDVAEQQAQSAPIVASDSRASGQWVYTSQYGWLFLPYGPEYTFEGTGDEPCPYAYVYQPGFGWLWVVAPWIWGWGTYPYFGVISPWHFAWYRSLNSDGWGWGGDRGGDPEKRIATPSPNARAPARPGGFGGPRGSLGRRPPSRSGAMPGNRATPAAGNTPAPRSPGNGIVGGGHGGVPSSPGPAAGGSARGASTGGHGAVGTDRGSGKGR